MFSQENPPGYSWWGAVTGGTIRIPPPLPPLSAWRAMSRPSITTGPTLADSSGILALFRLSYFFPPELSYESLTQPRPEPQTFPPSKGTVRMGRGTEGSCRRGSRDFGLLWCLALPSPDEVKLLGHRKSQPPS